MHVSRSSLRFGSRGRRGSGLVVAVAVAVALISGCSSDGDVVVSTEELDAETTLAAAVDGLTSGRYVITTTIVFDEPHMVDADGDAPSLGGDITTVMEGEFAGDRMAGTLSMRTDPPDEMSGEDVEVVHVDGIQYLDIDGLSAESSWLPVLTDVRSDLFGDRSWLAVDTRTTSGASESFLEIADPTEVFDGVNGVEYGGTREHDGEAMQVITGRVDAGGLWEDFDDADYFENATEADIAIARYRQERVHTEIEVLLDSEGIVRRIEMRVDDDIEEQYRECLLLDVGLQMTVVIELSDIGADIEIEPPPADLVISSEELQAASINSVLDESGGSFGPSIDDMSFDGMPFDERTLERELLQRDAWVLGLDRAAVDAMSDEEIHAAMEQLEAELSSMPTHDTPMGPMNRAELLHTVELGLQMLGADPIDLTSFSDEDLAGLITAYFEDMESEVGAMLGESSFDAYEGCPT